MTARRFVPIGRILAAAALATVGLSLSAGDAHPVPVPAEQDHVTVEVAPTDHLVDGQEITVSVTARDGVTLNGVWANQCAAHPANSFEFGVAGARCAAEPLSPGHTWEVLDGPYAPGATTARFAYRVGTGTQALTDLFTGEVREVRCGPGLTPCLLGLWIQTSGNRELMVTVPLFFGDDAPPDALTVSTTGARVSGIVLVAFTLIGAGLLLRQRLRTI